MDFKNAVNEVVCSINLCSKPNVKRLKVGGRLCEFFVFNSFIATFL